MILDLYGTVKNNIVFIPDLPYVHFLDNHVVSVTQMFIKWKHKPINLYGTLNSTLIDRNSINTRQQLLFFNKEVKSLNARLVSYYTHVTPTQPAEYKIVCPSLQSSVFTIQLSKPADIENIYIQLKITNERVQPFDKKSL